jgi:hypothetical protein
MIAIQAIALATIRQFLSLRPHGSCCSSTEQSVSSATIGVSPESCSRTNDSSAAFVSIFRSFAIVGERVTRHAISCAGKMTRCHLNGDYAWQHPDARNTISMQSELSVSRQKQFATLHK